MIWTFFFFLPIISDSFLLTHTVEQYLLHYNRLLLPSVASLSLSLLLFLAPYCFQSLIVLL